MTIPKTYIKFMLILLSYDLLWLVLREVFDTFTYYTTSSDYSSLLIAVLLALSYVIMLTITVYPFATAMFKRKLMLPISINVLAFVIIVLNVIIFLKIDKSARYTEDGLSKSDLLILYLRVGLIIIVAVTSLIERNLKNYLFKLIIILSYCLTVDGISSMLTIYTLALVLFHKSKAVIFSLIIISPIALIAAILVKFGNIDNLAIIIPWIIGRFAVVLESAALYLSGEHYLRDLSDILSLLRDSFTCKLSFLFDSGGCPTVKSIGSANYYTLYNQVQGGSSPGFLGSIIMGSLLTVLPLFFFITATLQILRESRCKSIFVLLAFSIIIRPTYANLLDIYSILSITLVSLIFYMMAAKLRFIKVNY